MDIRTQLNNCKPILFLLSTSLLVLLLSSCASSDATRSMEDHINNTAQSAGFDSNSNYSISQAYQNTSQTTKGLLLGGAAGAGIGWVGGSGIGILPGMATGAILGGAVGAYYDSTAHYSDRIDNQGNKVVILGDQILIVIPSRRLFNSPISSELNANAPSILNNVAKFVAQNPNITVKVAAYTDPLGSKGVNLELSQQQANTVMKYLWKTGIDTRMLYAAGYGGENPVQQEGDSWGQGYNYRVEITLEKLPV